MVRTQIEIYIFIPNQIHYICFVVNHNFLFMINYLNLEVCYSFYITRL